jgi:hypothetical protein
MRQCSICGKEHEDQRDFFFLQEGLEFRDMLAGSECSVCAKNRILKKWRGLPRGVIRAESGRPKMDWRQFRDLDEELREDILTILFWLNVLSYSALGRWEIVAHNLVISPSLGLMPTFFSSEEHARGYAQAMLCSVSYGWEIRFVTKVISSEEVLRKQVPV